MKELDRVKTTVELPDLPAESTGTIVHVYENQLAVEVEFTNPQMVRSVHVKNLELVDEGH
jgi:hypothetical protein